MLDDTKGGGGRHRWTHLATLRAQGVGTAGEVMYKSTNEGRAMTSKSRKARAEIRRRRRVAAFKARMQDTSRRRLPDDLTGMYYLG